MEKFEIWFGLVLGIGITIILGLVITTTRDMIEQDTYPLTDEITEKESECELYAVTEKGMTNPYCHWFFTINECSCKEHYDNPCVEWEETTHTRACKKRKYTYDEQWDRGQYQTTSFDLKE